jgi:hypothetical protein
VFSANEDDEAAEIWDAEKHFVFTCSGESFISWQSLAVQPLWSEPEALF